MNDLIKKALSAIVIIILAIILIVSLRGSYGNPNDLDLLEKEWRDDGVFELSPERGRFALTYSIVENGSVFYTTNLARFTIPDLGYRDGKYITLFAPATSFLAIPGYVIGRYFGISQLGTFSTTALFGLINLILIFSIVFKISKNRVAALLAGIAYLFATPAFTYSVNMYQHQVSTFLILMSVFTLTNWNNFLSNSLVFLLCAFSVSVDYPNLFLMSPIGITALLNIGKLTMLRKKYVINIKVLDILTLLGVVPPLLFFMWFNTQAYGGAFNALGSSEVQAVRDIDVNGQPFDSKKIDPTQVSDFLNKDKEKEVTQTGFFKSRNILNGIYIHTLSPDRGIIVFAPIVLLGILGIIVLYKNKYKYLAMLLGVVGANLFLYSMWGDPWGGWAFGSRYMIPSYAIISIFLGVALSKFNRKWYFIIPFWILLSYSIGVNTLGALTTSTNPPKAESLALEQISGRQERYSYDRNWEFLTTRGTKSFAYHQAGYKYITPVQYYYLITGLLIAISTILTIAVVLNKNQND